MIELAAQAGIAALGSYLTGSVDKAVAKANNMLSHVRAGASNKVRDASNAFSLARFTQAAQLQAMSNKRVTQDLGEALTAANVNYARQKDVLAKSSFEDSIAEAEELGRQAAEAAAFGIGGDAVDVISGTTALKQARAEEDATRMRDQFDSDFSAAKGNMVLQAMTGLDNSTIFADLDYGIDVAQTQAVPSPMRSAIMAGLQHGGAQLLAQAGTDLYKKYSGRGPTQGTGIKMSKGGKPFQFLSGSDGFSIGI